MLSTAVVTAISVGLLGAAEPIQVAAPGLSMVNLDPGLQSFYTSSLAQQMNYEGVRVLTADDLGTLLGYERQQQLMGCPNETCRAEITAGLGVDGLLVGQVARTAETYRLEVRILATGTGAPLAAAGAQSPNEEGLLRSFRDVARQLCQQLSTRLGRPLVPQAAAVTTRWSTTKRLSWVPLGVGIAALAGGGVALSMARANHDRLMSASPERPLSPAQASQIVSTGKMQQTLGVAALGVGAACLAGAGALLLFGGDEEVISGVAVAPAGAGLSIAGSF